MYLGALESNQEFDNDSNLESGLFDQEKTIGTIKSNIIKIINENHFGQFRCFLIAG